MSESQLLFHFTNHSGDVIKHIEADNLAQALKLMLEDMGNIEGKGRWWQHLAALKGGLGIEDGEIVGLTLKGSHLNYSKFYDVKFRNCTFKNVDFSNAIFSWCKFKDVTFENCNFDSARFDESDLVEVIFDGGSATNIGISFCRFIRCSLTRLFLDNAYLYDLKFEATKLNWTNHQLLGFILQQEAFKLPYYDYKEADMLATYVRSQTGTCWPGWARFEHPKKEWAFRALANYIVKWDDHPRILDKVIRMLDKRKERACPVTETDYNDIIEGNLIEGVDFFPERTDASTEVIN